MLDIYKASAGAGKTFALTLEYFRTIFASPAEYKNILAVTFTNKATEEMKSRIINELHRLADGKTSDYGEALKQEFGFTDEQLKNRAVLLRTMLLHDYGRLAVTTIDRFFQRIIKAFTRELGIFPGYNVELDSDFVLLKAVDKVMQQVKDNPGLKNWISELMSSNVEEGKSWSIKSKIAELGEELFKENYMLFDKHILDKFSDKEFLKNYRSFLTATVQAYESRQAAIGQEAIGLIRSEGLEQTDFKGGKAGCVSYFYKLVAGNFDEPTATVRKGAQDSAAWVTKTSPRKATIGSICPRLMQLLQDILNRFDQDYSYYLSARMLSDNLYQLGILNDLYQEVRAYCDEKGLMLLSDTTHILNMLIADNDTSFLFEKCGNYYKHLMIDEFQDTSGMQWKNFRPLVVNSLSEGYRTMIVGDVKQSIYRWRNGDWSLLANEVERQFSSLGVNTVILKNNWRSAPEIVNFNNTFFEKAVGMLTDLYIADAGGEVKEKTIAEAYQGLQQIPRKKKKGYVEDANFDFMHRFYIDSEEYGLHPKTSHPRFTEHFTEELYYDCVDEEAPFGSDEGSDTLDSLEETIRKNPKLNFLDYPKYLIEHDWGMEYIPVESLDPEVVKKLASKKEMDMTQSDMVTYATAFGQIKITGRLSPKLQEQGVKAIKRLALLWGNGVTEIQSRMIDDLLSFPIDKD